MPELNESLILARTMIDSAFVLNMRVVKNCVSFLTSYNGIKFHTYSECYVEFSERYADEISQPKAMGLGC